MVSIGQILERNNTYNIPIASIRNNMVQIMDTQYTCGDSAWCIYYAVPEGICVIYSDSPNPVVSVEYDATVNNYLLCKTVDAKSVYEFIIAAVIFLIPPLVTLILMSVKSLPHTSKDESVV
jgi:hypothetical protein